MSLKPIATTARILVGVDGRLTIEAKPGGLLDMEETVTHPVCGRKDGPLVDQAIFSASGMKWRITIPVYDIH